MLPNDMTRRTLLTSVGVSIATALFASRSSAGARGDVAYASAMQSRDGGYSVLLIAADGERLEEFLLPGRGHAVIFHAHRPVGVVFARRPGNFALIFPTLPGGQTRLLTTLPGRHFYGHGVFSNDGKLLFATENDFENARGKIGIYEVADNYRRLGEFDTFGIGPHELVLSPDGGVLIVANGGIETHPDFGRQKLNLPEMRPSIAFIDRRDGSLLERQELPSELHQVSMRHLAGSRGGLTVFGGQYQGPVADRVPLVGAVTFGKPIRFFDFPDEITAELGNYIASVTVSADGTRAAVTAPRSGLVLTFDTQSGTITNRQHLPGASGAAFFGEDLAVSTSQGRLNGHTYVDVSFDNHLSAKFGTS